MSFDEFQKKVFVRKVGNKTYSEHAHQINHIQGEPENNCLDHLELCTASENAFLYAVEAADLYGTVFKRPAQKRPATAPRTRKSVFKRPAAAPA